MPQHFVQTVCVPKHLALRCCTRKFTHLYSQIYHMPSMYDIIDVIGKKNNRTTDCRYCWNVPILADTDYQSDYQCNSSHMHILDTYLSKLPTDAVEKISFIFVLCQECLIIHLRPGSRMYSLVEINWVKWSPTCAPVLE